MFDFLGKAASRTSLPLILVDIGAAGGIQPKWQQQQHRRRIRPVLVEPHPTEAARLRPSLRNFPDALIIEHGLAATAGLHTLNIAHWPGCTSLLEPDAAVLDGYAIAPPYATEQRVSITCLRFDELHRAGQVPMPDVIKVDVEGYEYQVLQGFGDLLLTVIGIETEAWFYPVFKGQKLLHDLVALLTPYDLRLRRIEEVEGFEGDLVYVNAFFTRSKAGRPDLTPERQRQFDFLQHVWGL